MNDTKPKSEGSILVIDDEINELKAMIIGMKLEGFDVLGVSSCTEAMDALDRQSFDAALIDLMMPEMNG
ncbi:MAG TPA: response regulator, partial [Polyangia bacterium]|nr:response regulator [Polyangia bacterium]